MDAPPVNRLLQLLRQRPAETPELAHVSHNRVSPPEPNPPTIPLSDIQPATESDAREIHESSTQPARQSNILPVPKGGRQPARSSTQPVTDSDTPEALQGSTQSATSEDVSLAVTGLSKGQQRVLQFLLSNRDVSNRSHTIPIGYDAISRHCLLSRSGSRKVIGELCQRGLITRVETKRGEMQGSVYLVEGIILYATQSSIPEPQKSSTQSATHHNGSCSSNKELLLQDLTLEGAFQDLHPRSLLPYLDKFDTVEDLQNFLDIAHACIQAAKAGHGKPIQNPHGFLFAQLRAGYINPPEGYKSRKIRAQELRNQQLEEELASLRRLKEREQELQFELFVTQLTAEDVARLEREAQEEVQLNIGLSPAFQLDMHKDRILKQWFVQRTSPQQEDRRHA
jgi:hypothetical protein